MKRFLIVVDCQHDFIDGSLGSEDAKNRVLPNVVKKVKEYKDNGDYVIFTRDTHFENYLETFEGKHLPVEHCIEGTEGWKIHEDLLSLYGRGVDNSPRVGIINKHTFGSLVAKGMEPTLSSLLFTSLGNNEEFELEFCGLCTDICVVSNALIMRAICPDVRIVVDSSCCGGTSSGAHEAALTVMKSCQIEII